LPTRGYFMSSSTGSAKIIIIAFIANLGIAIAKFVGALMSGSASLLAEAIHSLVDCSNQILLLIGNKKSLKKADSVHPLGYGREAFFWSFMVAILLFSMGGLFAIYEGYHKLHMHEEVSSPLIGIGILIVSLFLEGYSFFACYKEIKIQNTYGSLWNWFRKTKNAELLVIFTEDAAAMTGLIIATICLSLAWFTGQPFWDSLGSILVGIILVIVAVLLAIEVKSFIIGESSSDEIRDFVTTEALKLFPGGRVLNVIAIQTGSNEVMLSCKVHPGSIQDVDQTIKLVNQLEVATKAKFSSIRWQFVELDKED
jgi:cation diffusion facilitator family transporter